MKRLKIECVQQLMSKKRPEEPDISFGFISVSKTVEGRLSSLFRIRYIITNLSVRKTCTSVNGLICQSKGDMIVRETGRIQDPYNCESSCC